MAGVDPDWFDPDRNTLSTKVVDVAAAIARTEGSDLHIVNAWRAPSESALRSRAALPADNVSRYVRRVWQDQLKRVTALVGKNNVKTLQHRIHLVKGEVARVIPELTVGSE
jgi:hypothetical protein